MKLAAHIGAVLGVAFSPDGQQLASGSWYGSVRIWDLITGTAIGEPLYRHKSTVNSVSYSPNGQFIASRSWDGTIRVWNATSREVTQFCGLSEFGNLVYSPDGRKLACCGKEGIVVRDALSGEVIGKKDQIGRIYAVAYSANGAYLASGGSDVRLWNGETLSEIAVLKGHTNSVYSVAFPGDDSELLSADGYGTMARWNATSHQMIGGPIAAHEAPINTAAYSPDGQLIASGSGDGSIRVWDVNSISDVESSTHRLGKIRSLSCSPGGNEFASASSDGSVRIHASNSGTILRTLIGHIDQVSVVVYSPDGKLLVSVSTDRTLRVWDAETGSGLRVFRGHTRSVTSVLFDTDGKHVISASFDGTIRRWNVEIDGDVGEIISSHLDEVRYICLSPNERILAFTGRDGVIRFINLTHGSIIDQLFVSDAPVKALAFSPNGKLIASGNQNSMVQLWSIDTQMELKRFQGQFSSHVLTTAFSKDGRQLLCGSGGGTIRQWDIETGAELRRLASHTHAILSAVYSFDGRRILSGSVDGTVRIWSSDTTQSTYVREIGQELLSLLLDDGWIKSRTGDLLLWVPPEYRNGISDTCEVCIPSDAPNGPVRLDWSKLMSGTGWTNMFRRD